MMDKLLKQINSHTVERDRGALTIAAILTLLENLLGSNKEDKILLLETITEDFKENL